MGELTPFQTVGPFFEIAIPAPGHWQLAGDTVIDRRIRIEGTVRDGVGAPVVDALIETWQADADGHYVTRDQVAETIDARAPTGLGRIPTDAAGQFALETIRPGTVPGPDGSTQAPHVLVGVLARGILGWLVTRIYFEGDPANEHDTILALVPPARRSTLIARRTGERSFRFDIVLQGDGETVFFDV